MKADSGSTATTPTPSSAPDLPPLHKLRDQTHNARRRIGTLCLAVQALEETADVTADDHDITPQFWDLMGELDAICEGIGRHVTAAVAAEAAARKAAVEAKAEAVRELTAQIERVCGRDRTAREAVQ